MMKPKDLTEKEIEALYPEFKEWVHKVKGYSTSGGVCHIALWYEWLKGLPRDPKGMIRRR